LGRKDEKEIKGFKGALVFEPAMGLHTTYTIYLDFKAMYPSIFIYYNICPTTLVKDSVRVEKIKTPYGTEFVSKKVRVGIIPQIVSKLIKERDFVKRLLRISTDENERRALDARQEALKRMTNAFYGYTGYVRGRLYLLEIANAVTSCGRFLIQKTKEIVEKNPNYKVIYGDTDSIFVKPLAENLEKAFEIGKKLEEQINGELGEIVRMKIESVFKTLLILTKKRYAGLSIEKIDSDYKEKIIMKGIETVRRDWCDLTSKTLYEVLRILLIEQNPKKVLDFVRTVIKKIEKNEIPLEDLVITKSISKPLHAYKGIQPHVELVKRMKRRSPAEAPGVGDRVGFVIIQGSQLISKRAEDPEYVKRRGLKIDSRYYIESQILPPLERVFDVIGIKKSELLGTGKQLLLAEAIKNKKQIKEIVSSIEGIICNKCNKIYRRTPLNGKCLECGGEIVFYSGSERARYFNYEFS
jgi:DNA polymerase I